MRGQERELMGDSSLLDEQLLTAVENHDWRKVTKLLRAGANPNAMRNGVPAIMLAVAGCPEPDEDWHIPHNESVEKCIDVLMVGGADHRCLEERALANWRYLLPWGMRRFWGGRGPALRRARRNLNRGRLIKIAPLPRRYGCHRGFHL